MTRIMILLALWSGVAFGNDRIVHESCEVYVSDQTPEEVHEILSRKGYRVRIDPTSSRQGSGQSLMRFLQPKDLYFFMETKMRHVDLDDMRPCGLVVQLFKKLRSDKLKYLFGKTTRTDWKTFDSERALRAHYVEALEEFPRCVLPSQADSCFMQ